MANKRYKYRIDNKGCSGAFVHAIEHNKYLFDTIDECRKAVLILDKTEDWRHPPYEIVKVDTQKKNSWGSPMFVSVVEVIDGQKIKNLNHE